MEKEEHCPFAELCIDCHPESDMVERRKTCTNKNCKQCGVYWAFLDGYQGLDEPEH